MPRFDRLPPASADVMALNPEAYRNHSAGRVGKDTGPALPTPPGDARRLVVALPLLPPTVNHAYAPNAGGGKRLTDEAISFKRRAEWEAKANARATGFQPGLRMAFTVYVAVRKGADADNRIKLSQDSVASGLGFNDTAIEQATAIKIPATPTGPRCVMVLEVLS